MSVALEELLVQLAQQEISGIQQAAQQATLDTVQQTTSAILSLLEQVNSTLLAGLTTVESNQAQIIGRLNAIITALPGINGRGPSVTLPSNPPAGFLSSVGVEVWSFPMPLPFGNDAQTALSGVAGAARNVWGEVGGFRVQETHHVWAFGSNVVQVDLFGRTLACNDDLGLAIPGDTPVSWITRLNPTQGWTTNANGQTVLTQFAAGNPSGGLLAYWLDVDQGMIDQAVAATRAEIVTAPVWPGLGNVTITGPVALVDGLALVQPMNGVITTITAVTPPVGFYPFGPIKSYVRVGSVIFENDDSDFEAAQGIGLEDQIVCCRSMAVASSCRFRVKSGVTGQAWSWIRN